ncbi:MAG: ParB/RepB/Spo0J family partition protein [Clostridiales bacterium]|nr:ParB/RepB/Spo0J family partition protein [Clostridiales bacterium]
MAKKAHGLGRGLDSLFGMTEEEDTLRIREIDIGELDPNPDQPRKHFDKESIAQLADSIREQGILQPLLVVASDRGRYRIVAGERRFRAARLAGLETIPCIVKDLDVIQEMEIALIENLQREDLNPMDAAMGIQALMNQCGYTQEKVAERLGKSRAAVANLVRLLSLPDEVTDLVREGRLTAGHARAIAGLNDSGEQVEIARKSVAENLNVREVEKITADRKAKKKEQKRKTVPGLPAELAELQETVLRKTGMKCTLTGTANKGRILLEYGSREDLERLNDLLERAEE